MKTEKVNKGRNGGSLQVGNPGNKGGGRPSLSALNERRELIDQLWAVEIPDDAHPLVKRTRELAMTSPSSATVEYLISQKIGAPRTKIEMVLSSQNFLEALAAELPEHGLDRELCQAILAGVHARLTPDA